MKRLFTSILPVLVLWLVLTMPASAIELMRWERLPLAVPLIVGQERVIFIDRNVRVGVPGSLTGRLRVQSTGGTIYLLAQEPIEPTRLQLQDVQTGALILIDIAALVAPDGTAQLEPVRIVEGDNPATHYGRDGQSAAASQTGQSPQAPQSVSRETPIPVVLTRYAAQNLYAPLRTVEPVPGIARVNLARHLTLDTLLPTLPMQATAMAAWRLEDYWLTAVRLRNTSHQAIVLDPRMLQGDFISATFQHPHLGAAGDSLDTTVLYLVTRKHGLRESLLPAISPIDASINVPASLPAQQPQGVSNEK